MENNIVREFQNLRVFSNGNIIIMDQLVKDLSSALDESSRGHRQLSENVSPNIYTCRPHKKRRGKKRRSDLHLLKDCGTISEASESSIDDSIRNYMDILAQTSDSDDISKHMHRLGVPITDAVPPVESDSVTENFSPTRPQRRRRKYKRMAIDSTFDDNEIEEMKPDHDTTLQDINQGSGDCQRQEGEQFVLGKRKRNTKCRHDSFSQPSTSQDCQELMEQEQYSQESSSLSSSETESDGGIVTNDEAREADDEQSDFFHEPGPVCGIPTIIPWWENKHDDHRFSSGVSFQRLISKTLENLPRSQLNIRSRVSRLLLTNGREIRVGRRKLKEKIPGYSMTSYIQDREKWMLSGPYPQLTNGANQSYDIKRQRLTPPPSPEYKDIASTSKSSSARNKSRDVTPVLLSSPRKSDEMESTSISDH
ncbi:hypothetical protein LOTGIDRAFT_166870 [Lottia gigantea]|uniref:Uncharacterized protein n=1 Tax=Lottia gigantea TaxID=225164 RepID=V3Z7S7_LOTGI|nr:hypothetical protein LOTGIDRAFT_166870 [Lottia gigantea]ESO86868.1 hypothetical protein LOTGIDRAFT_166870 [Lottia gigantea]